MSCSCTTKTLRLFIRHVAQLDLAASSTSTHHRPKSLNIRRFNAPSVSYPSPPYSRAYSLAYSPQLVRSSDEDAPIKDQEEVSSATEGRKDTTHDEIDYLDDLFMEITPESIDALAAETRSELADFQSREPEESIQSTETMEGLWIQREPIDIFSKPLKKARWITDEEKIRFRSIKNRQRTDEEIVARSAGRDSSIACSIPEQYSTAALADHFQVSAEAIRRILRSTWVPKPEEEADRERRWFQRGKNIWGKYAELGVKPPRKWREEGIGRGKPEWMKKAAPVLTTSRPGNSQPRRPATISLDDEMEDRIL
ncbi:mitochondrion organization and biogenesis protein [Botrytis cinerea]